MFSGRSLEIYDVHVHVRPVNGTSITVHLHIAFIFVMDEFFVISTHVHVMKCVHVQNIWTKHVHNAC